MAKMTEVDRDPNCENGQRGKEEIMAKKLIKLAEMARMPKLDKMAKMAKMA